MMLELRPWGRTRRRSVVRELVVFAHGAVAHIAFDREPEEILERLEDVLAELRAFISTRARGGIETKSPGSRR